MTKSFTTDFEIEFEGSSKNWHIIELEVKYWLENVGIGEYEYCGMKGHDNRHEMQYEIISACMVNGKKTRIIDIDKMDEETYKNNIKKELLETIKKEYHDAVMA